MKYYSKQELKARLQHVIDSKKAVIIASAGLGMAAKYIERGGADMICINAPAYYRMQGLPALTGCIAVGNCDDLVADLCRRMQTVIQDTPVIAGVYCNEKMLGDMSGYFSAMKEMGVSGVMTFPSCALHDGKYRKYLETGGNGLQQELRRMKLAGEMGLTTIGMAIDLEDAVAVAQAELDMLVINLGYRKVDLDIPVDNAVSTVNRIEKAVHDIHPEMQIFIHGGPLSSLENMQYILERTHTVGLLDGHFALPLAMDKPIADVVRDFKSRKLR